MIDWIVPILTYDITLDRSRICRSSIELEKPEVKSRGKKGALSQNKPIQNQRKNVAMKNHAVFKGRWTNQLPCTCKIMMIN